MRRRRSNIDRIVTLRFIVAAGGSALASRSVRGQDAAATGVVSLLYPVGANGVGMGSASAAAAAGTEAVWSNPAGLARLTRREVAIHHGQDVALTRDALAVAIPSRVFGVVALSAYLVNAGESPATDDFGNPLGAVLSRDVVFAASYASRMGSRVTAGLSYKLVQSRVDCSGNCVPGTAVVGTTSAIDAGVQFRLPTSFPAIIGAAVRNIGPNLQIRDREQADPLPRQVRVGVEVEPPNVARLAPGVTLRLSADVSGGIVGNDALPSVVSVGADAAYRGNVHLRGGYASGGVGAGGPSLGLGYENRRVSIDIARLFTGLSADVGETPTYISARLRF